MSKTDLKKYAVLYVDDEEQALKYFPKLFGADLRCLTANGVDQARAVIKRAGDTIGIVISAPKSAPKTATLARSDIRRIP